MDKATTRRGPTGKQMTFGGLVLAFVIALCTYAQPILNERMGWNLPALPKTGSAEVAESKTTTKTASEPKPGPLADRPVASSTKPTIKPAPASDLNLLSGLLKDLGGEDACCPTCEKPLWGPQSRWATWDDCSELGWLDAIDPQLDIRSDEGFV